MTAKLTKALAWAYGVIFPWSPFSTIDSATLAASSYLSSRIRQVTRRFAYHGGWKGEVRMASIKSCVQFGLAGQQIDGTGNGQIVAGWRTDFEAIAFSWAAS